MKNLVTDDLFEDGLVDIRTGAKQLAVGVSTIYNLMASGQLYYVKLGKATRIPKRALNDLMRANLKGGWNADNQGGLANG